ncbi:MAG: hypothetical protein RQ752_01885 [Thermohalobaculum sp.]|nr:hypothetical protein [Thermohalobaculum sp.]
MGRKGQPAERIASCRSRGSRSILPATTRGERLVCHGCGAPIRVIEAMAPAAPSRARPGARHAHPATPHPAERPGAHQPTDRPLRRRKGKARPGLLARLGRAFDDLDDILDVFD